MHNVDVSVKGLKVSRLSNRATWELLLHVQRGSSEFEIPFNVEHTAFSEDHVIQVANNALNNTFLECVEVTGSYKLDQVQLTAMFKGI